MCLISVQTWNKDGSTTPFLQMERKEFFPLYERSLKIPPYKGLVFRLSRADETKYGVNKDTLFVVSKEDLEL